MAAQPLRIEIRSDPEMVVLRGTVMQHLGEATTDARWMRAIGMYGREIVLQRQFRDEGAYLGSRWAEIDSAYRDWKVRVFGPDADFIGRRSLVLRDAMTARDLSPISRQWTDLGGDTHTVVGRPILTADDHTVTFGAGTEGDGVDYAATFSARRPVFGTGKLPPETEAEMGAVLKLRYLAAFRGVAEVKADAAVLSYLSSIDMGDLYQ